MSNITLLIILSLSFVCILLFALLSVPKSDFDQKQDDEAQMAFIKELKEKNK